MIIFHVIVGLESGGAEGMLLRLVAALPSHKHIIVSLTNIGCIGQRLIACGHTVHAIDFRPLSAFSSLFTLWKLIRKYRPNVIQTWMYHSDLLGGLIGRAAGVDNIVWNIRNTEIPQRRLSTTGIVIRLCALCSHFIPSAIVCCANASISSHTLLGYCVDRMTLIPNGYSSQAWTPSSSSKTDLRESLELPIDSLIIGIIGRYDRLKGYDIFIEAASLLTERCDSKILFLMVGRNIDHQNNEISELIAQKGGRAQFKLLGEINDISKIYGILDIFCLASHAEGFPNVVAEAMLMRVPCVVTDVGDAALIVGTTGKVVRPNNPLALAEALTSVISMNESLRLQMGTEARKRIVENFDIHIIAKQYENLYLNGEIFNES